MNYCPYVVLYMFLKGLIIVALTAFVPKLLPPISIKGHFVTKKSQKMSLCLSIRRQDIRDKLKK